MRYGFYPGCAYHSSAGYPESVGAVSRALGVELVELEDWNCCGATVYFSLDKDKALALNARVLALAAKGGFSEIMTVCNACYNTLRKGRDALLADRDALDRINRRLASEGLAVDPDVTVHHYLEVLADRLPDDVWESALDPNRPEIKAAGYYGCQFSRPWGDVDHPENPAMLERLISRLGFTPVEHGAKTMCCGASHNVPYPENCGPLIDRIVRAMASAGAELAVTICPLCQFNLDSGQKGSDREPLPILYFTQLVGLALGLSPQSLGLGKLLIPLKGKS